jgi:curved DNA-binding protein CbpA
MKTLYDLLGALPDDDAESLRAAFRRAAKANHPDFNPGNPEASERFRRIVRANAILNDEQQRAAYDRLLEVARRQQSRKPRRSVFSETMCRLTADAIASAAVSVVLVGGFLLLRPVDRLPLASAQVTEASRPEPTQTPTVNPTEISDVNPRDVKAPTKPDGIAAAVTTGIAPASAPAPARDVATKDAQYYRERAISAYRSGDLYLALVNFDLAIQQDPGLSESYIDRGIVFHRLGDMESALSDVAEAKRIDALHRNKTPSTASAR